MLQSQHKNWRFVFYLTEAVRSLNWQKEWQLSHSWHPLKNNHYQLPHLELKYVCPIVFVGICLKGYPDVSVSLHVVPTIYEPFSFQPVKARVRAYSHLTGLDLANDTEDREQLLGDILIGCDHYWDLVMGSICGGEKGPTTLHPS